MNFAEEAFDIPFRALQIRLPKLWIALQLLFVWRLFFLFSLVSFFLLEVFCTIRFTFSNIFQSLLYFSLIYTTFTARIKKYSVDLSLWSSDFNCIYPHLEHFLTSYLLIWNFIWTEFTLLSKGVHCLACRLNSKFCLHLLISKSSL